MIEKFPDFEAAILEASTNGIIVIGDDGLIAYSNAALSETFGYSRSELFGQPIEIVLPQNMQDRHKSLRDGFFQNPSSRKMGGNTVLFGRKKSGEEFPLEVGLSHAEVMGKTFAFANVIDISHRWAKEQELEIYRQNLEAMVKERTEDLDMALRTSEANSRFLGDIMHSLSHEFRTPLNAILGFSELLLVMQNAKSAAPDRDTISYLEQIKSAGDDLLELSKKATQMSIVSKGRAIAQLEPQELHPILEEAVRKVEKTFKQFDATVELQEEMSCRLSIDRVMFGRVLVIILENAAKYGGPSASVSITFNSDGKRCYVSIDDAGPGIPKEKRLSVFNPFERLDAKAGVISGMGLGLTLAQSYMRSMGGSIVVEESSKGGARFTLDLPAT